MMSDGISIQIEGLDELRQALATAKQEVRKAANEEVRKATFRVQTAAIKRIQQGSKTGETYEKYSPRRTHQASAPGQPPASDTGRLASSIENRTDGLEGVVFTRVDYGRYLEFGTRKISARPWLLPSLEEDAPQFMRGLRGVLR